MSGKSRLDRVYAQLMSDHPYGWGLYKKVTTRDLHPGSCGYFDPEGDWNTITDLSDPQNLTTQGWTIPDDQLHDSEGPKSATWGPKTSSAIRSCRIGGTAGGIGVVSTSLTMSFESHKSQGAVLITENPVLKHKVGDELSALQWMAENKAEMMRRYKSIIRRHGVWIVTKTYSTRRCAIAIMADESSSTEIKLNSVQGVLTLTPNSAWSGISGSSCIELHEDEDGVVVFISGIYFSQKLFGTKMGYSRDQRKQKDKIFRGDNDGSGQDDSDELDVEYYPPLDEDEDENGDETEDEFT
ncbi:hypothetical protein ACHAPX_009727 [Trichoderma viride]